MSLVLNLMFAALLCIIAYFPALFALRIIGPKKLTSQQRTFQAKIFSLVLFFAFCVMTILERFGLF